MTTLTIDLSGTKGLLPNYFGDLNDNSTAQPHLRYLGEEGQIADGYMNPSRRLGYMTPANNAFTDITDSFNADIVAAEYDSVDDVVYLAEDGNTIWQLDGGLDDTSVSSFLTVDQSLTEVLRDIEVYELNGKRALYYAYNITDDAGYSSDIGVYGLTNDSGIVILDNTTDSDTSTGEAVVASGSVEVVGQLIDTDDTEVSFDRVKLPIFTASADDGGYTLQVSIQDDATDYSHNSPASTSKALSIAAASQTAVQSLVGDMSFEAWIRFNGAVGSIKVVDRFTSGVGGYEFSASSSSLDLGAYDGTNRNADRSWSPVADTWYHVACSRSGDNVTFYVNGSSIGTDSGNFATGNIDSGGSIDLEIGNTGSNGSVDILDIRIWSEARNGSDIIGNYKDRLVGNETNLIAYWQLNNALTDSTSNNNDLTQDAGSFVQDSPIYFSEPDGTADATATLAGANIPLGITGTRQQDQYLYFDLSSTITRTGRFWIVVEPTTFANMTGSDQFNWMGGASDTYSAGISKTFDGTSWSDGSDNSTDTDLSFALLSNQAVQNQAWLSNLSGSTYRMDNTADIFFRKADNGFMYAFENNKVHKIDGGATGGNSGTFNENVLLFPSYFNIADALDTRGRMYIGVQANPLSGSSDNRAYSEGITGVYLWDRRSTIVGTRDFLPLYGVRDIKSIYLTPLGDVRCICIGDDKFAQIRSITDNGRILARLGESAYPNTRDGVKTLGSLSVWYGADGTFYGHGQAAPGFGEELFKLGTMSGEATGAFTTGVLISGNEESTQPQQGLIFTYEDTASAKIQRWYPFGIGTIDSENQIAHQGDVYSKVYFLPNMSNVGSCVIRCIPTENTGATTIATIKYYFNQSSTAGITKTVTLTEASKGYIEHQINKQYITSVQIEVEWATSAAMGTDTFMPFIASIEYQPTGTLGQVDSG